MHLLFMDHDDVCDTWGDLSFAASSLEPLDGLAAPSDGRVLGVYPCPDGFEVFIREIDGESWRLARYTTADFAAYAPLQVVLRPPDDARQWLGHCAMARRDDTGELLLLIWVRSKPGHAAHFFRSPDGLAWTDLNPAAPAYTDHDACGLLWHAAAGHFVMLQVTYQLWHKRFPDNIGDRIRRVLTTRTSPDGVHWEPAGSMGGGGPHHPAERLIVPDERDPEELEFYWLRAFAYHDRFIGMMLNYAPSPQAVNPLQHPGPGFREDRQPSRHGPHLSTEWWMSTNGMATWRRPYRDVVAGGECAYIFHSPVVCDDTLVWLQDGRAWGLPVDRIAGAHARANAEFSTPPFTVPDAPLVLNARAAWLGDRSHGMLRQAYIMAELLQADGTPVPGFEREKCTLQDVDGLRLPLRWDGVDTASLAGTEARLRLFLRDATIYALTAP